MSELWKSIQFIAPRKQGFDDYIGRKHNFHIGKPGVWFHNEEPQGAIKFREAHQKLTDATIAFMQEADRYVVRCPQGLKLRADERLDIQFVGQA